MAQEYISYIQTENLLRSWITIQGIRESLGAELKALENSDDESDDYILTQVMGNKVLSDIPPSGKISDTTSGTALSYQGVMKSDFNQVLNIVIKQKYCVELVDDKLDIAFKRLPYTQQRIIKLFYIEDKFWAEVLDELKKDRCYYSKQQAQLQRRKGIEKVQRIAKITVDTYLQVMKLVEVE